MSKINRPQGMSQLDYLWLNYGGYQIGTTPSSIPQQNVILNELAVTSLIKNATNGGIISLEYTDHPTNSELVQLVGRSVDGQLVTFVEMPKEIHIQSFVGREVNSLDIEKGCQYPLKTKVLSIVLSNGKEFLVSLDSLGLVLSGAETKTSVSEIIDGKVYNHVKIDKASLSVIELKESTYGISAHLNISPDITGVKLSKETNGLKARIPLGNTGMYIKFDRMSLNQYMSLPNKDDSTVYFISDKPYIFVGSQRYGVDNITGPITGLVYDKEAMTLSYSTSEGALETLKLGPASATDNGMLSKSDYIELQKFKTALDGIVSVKDYVNSVVNNFGTSIVYGDIQDNKRPLYLKNSNGDILSTVWTDVETYLANSINRQATAQDVIEAAQVGVIIEEGDRIIILSLTNGNKHYIKLQDLIVSQNFVSSKTIKFTVNDKNVTADLALSNNKILYVTEDGLSAGIEIVKDGNFIKVYGYDQTQPIGKFMAPTKELQSTLFIPRITQEQLELYPPTQVDWKGDKSVIIGDDYYLLFYKDYNDKDQIYYISMPKVQVRISDIEGNLLKTDDNGDLYVLFEWIEQN